MAVVCNYIVQLELLISLKYSSKQTFYSDVYTKSEIRQYIH